jgi:hypothetical protein
LGKVADQYFYNAGGDLVSRVDILGAIQHYKGTTLDGCCIYHTVYFDAKRQKHISYDTVKIGGAHHYILGSGYERNRNSSDVVAWDLCDRVTWLDALKKSTCDLIQIV